MTIGKKEKCEALLLRNQLCFPLYLCSKEITRKYTEVLSEFDLTYTQYIVMMFFWERRTSNVKEAGEILMLDPSTLTPVLKKLESKGFLKRERSTEDERILNVTLTEKGEELSEKAADVPEKMRECYGLGSEDRDELYRLVYRLLGNLTGYDDNEKEKQK